MSQVKQAENVVISKNKDKNNDKNKDNKEKKDLHNDCLELGNIRYKTMLEHGAKSEIVPKNKSNNAKDIEAYLEKEKKQHKHLTWSRLDRSSKIKKLHEYADNYGEKEKLSDKEVQDLKLYFTRSINRKKLHRVKEVSYDKEKECILDVPQLIFSKTTRKFTLKRSAQRSSTLSSLGPGNTRKKRSNKKKSNDKIEGDIKT